MTRFHCPIVFLLTIFLYTCTPGKQESSEQDVRDSVSAVAEAPERYRPLFHFTPRENWTNDPNGLVQFNGIYHLFYQYNPFGIQWGHMSWGHATSEDLIHWQHHPVAIYEEDDEMIFSGSAVADVDNTSGFCSNDEGCLVAVYTSNIDGKVQYQSLAYSNDEGRTWTKYEGNPVLDKGLRDFRDPKVFWYEPDKKWVMVVSVPLEFRVEFYSSPDLIHWDLTGHFGNQGDVTKIWECPDLVRVPVEDTNEYKWVLIISSGSPYGDYTGMQYFTGEFDGLKFTADKSSNDARWLDYGKDFYAGITYNNLPEGMNPVLIGWVNNWKYANDIPTGPWRGMMSIPRELTLRKAGRDFNLRQRPVASFYEYIYTAEKLSFKDRKISENDKLLDDISAGSCLLRVVFENTDAKEFGIDILKNAEKKTRIGYNVGEKSLFINREESGQVDFNEAFPSTESAPIMLEEGKLSLDILVDQSVIEIFADSGLRVMTEQVFPGEDQGKMQLYTSGGICRIIDFELYKIR